jgi:hypothetical protein
MEENILLDLSDFDYRPVAQQFKPLDFPIEWLDFTPEYKKKIDQQYLEEKIGAEFPDEVSRGFDKYEEVVDMYRNSKNPKLAIQKHIKRMEKKNLKRQGKKPNRVKFTKKPIQINF